MIVAWRVLACCSPSHSSVHGCFDTFGVLLVGVLKTGCYDFGSIIRAPDFGKLPHTPQSLHAYAEGP